ncbi:hypothetical protein PO124_11140 [Bacillus licheniformis]|nr:hypothetical protein [Bacillus licheniformis]
MCKRHLRKCSGGSERCLFLSSPFCSPLCFYHSCKRVCLYMFFSLPFAASPFNSAGCHLELSRKAEGVVDTIYATLIVYLLTFMSVRIMGDLFLEYIGRIGGSILGRLF